MKIHGDLLGYGTIAPDNLYHSGVYGTSAHSRVISVREIKTKFNEKNCQTNISAAKNYWRKIGRDFAAKAQIPRKPTF